MGMENKYITHRVFVVKRKRKRPTGKPVRRWEGNIKSNLKDLGREGVDWLHLAQDRN
jgi:hypothetical protein